MLTDMHVLESDGMILLDVPAEQGQATLERLDQFLFTEDVQLVARCRHDGRLAAWPARGGDPRAVLDGASGLEDWADYHHDQLAFAGAPVSVARIDQLGVPGYCVFVEPAHERRIARRRSSPPAPSPCRRKRSTAARIEAGYPVFGVDMTEDTIPLEAGIEARAISFTKGCYVGQEVIIRVLHRGGGRVAKKLVVMRIDGAAAECAAGKLFSGEREIGRVTSAAHSPRLGRDRARLRASRLPDGRHGGRGRR